ncbi:hypothetical protein [Phenylobacterium sp.]|uniref:hypothetical protein n=1 Tax=Phenylobacterium sp. TaxID=1871053 RepID=UPI003561C618
MALLDLTPSILNSSGSSSGLTIEAAFVASRREAELCASRLRALASVTSADVASAVLRPI